MGSLIDKHATNTDFTNKKRKGDLKNIWKKDALL